MERLERQLDAAFKKLRISDQHQKSLREHLDLLKEKDYATWAHSVRVGLNGMRVAEHLGINPRTMFFPGLLHDFGKLGVEDRVLKKPEGFTDADMRKMVVHALQSYRTLAHIYPFSAEVAVRHHEFQVNPYPKRIPHFTAIRMTADKRKEISRFASYLSLIDYHDALTNRADRKTGKPARMTSEQSRAAMLVAHPEHAALITQLYAKGIFH